VATNSVARRLVPYAATVALAFVLLALERPSSPGEVAAAGVLALFAVAMSVLPWASAPLGARLAPWMVFLVAVFLMRDASDGSASGIGVLALLPICWLALYGSRTELVLGIVAVAAFWALPVLLIGGVGYPDAQLRTALIYVAVAGLVGMTVQPLVAALAANAADVARVSAAILTVPVAPDARGEICAAARDVSGAAFALLFEPDDDGKLRSTAMAGLPHRPLVLDRATERSATCLAFNSGEAVFARSAGRDPSVHPEMWRDHGEPASMLFEPVLHAGASVGVLVVGWSRRPNARSGRALIRLLAAETATAMSHADLLEQLNRMAATDSLTGLPNRRAWNRVFETESRRSEGRLCVAMLDLDRFKAFNDRHGHLAGDRYLKQVAAAWQAQLRPGDVLARIGGEEFAVLLTDCSLADASAAIERLRAATPAGETCSAGLAMRLGDEPLDAVMARADDALYAAKAAGRDRLEMARG
jgi:diguanylate cyclase (GGDEF)-like protein